MDDRFLIFGHRGAPKRFPENTLASFEECLRGGADGFETDLRLLFDRTAVLYHDDELEEADVESLTFTQCAERGAMVERLTGLSAFAGRAQMILEVKRSKWEDILIEQISDWPSVVVASFDHDGIAELHRRGVTFPLGITFHGSLHEVGAYAERIGATWAFPAFHYVSRDMVSELHDRGIRVVPWTANRKAQWERLREVGCDGVITDYPAEAVAWRGEVTTPVAAAGS